MFGADGQKILRFDGSTWSEFGPFLDSGVSLSVFGAHEGYYGRCWGWGSWTGSAWTTHADQFDFCDLQDIWGMRGSDGALALYAVGSNNWGNGVRVWKFDEASQSFGSKDGYVFGDGSGYLIGQAYRV